MAWLYIFLCFGYMTGADWRNYEAIYITGLGMERFIREPASFLTLYLSPKIIPDFWIFLGLIKCFYLHSVQILVSMITKKWLSVLALSIPALLAFMLIQNPLRFMLAATIINYALLFVYRYMTETEMHNIKVLIRIFFLIILSILFHNSCVVFLILIPCVFLSPRIEKISSLLIFIIYIIVTIFSSSIDNILEMKRLLIIIMQKYMEISDYAEYESDNNESIFAIGNILRIAFLMIVLASRKAIVNNYKYGNIIFGVTIIYFFLSRVLILIPTGFRLALPFVVFYIIYSIWLIKQKRFYAQIIIIYSLISFGRSLWSSYDFIPYSNSIPYIIIGHKPFKERNMYNLNQYKARTGETFDMELEIEL